MAKLKTCGIKGCRCMEIARKRKKRKATYFDHAVSIKKFGYCMIKGCRCSKRRPFSYSRNA